MRQAGHEGRPCKGRSRHVQSNVRPALGDGPGDSRARGRRDRVIRAGPGSERRARPGRPCSSRRRRRRSGRCRTRVLTDRRSRRPCWSRAPATSSPPTGRTPEPTVRVQFLAVCPDGTSFSWGVGALPATITSKPSSRACTSPGPGSRGTSSASSHTVSVDVTWTGVGKVETKVNGPGSKRDQRAATAVGKVIFDGARSSTVPPTTRPGRRRSSASTSRGVTSATDLVDRELGGPAHPVGRVVRVVDPLVGLDVVEEQPVDQRLAQRGDRREQRGRPLGVAAGYGGAPEPGPVLAQRGSLLLRGCSRGSRPGRAAGCRCRSRPSRAARCGRRPRPTRGCCRGGSRRAPGCPAGRTRRRRRTAAAARRPARAAARRRRRPARSARGPRSRSAAGTNTSGRQSGAPTSSSSPTRSTHAVWRPTSSSTTRRSTGSSAPQWSSPATWASRIRGPSAAISGGTTAGSSRCSIAPSWAKNGGTTLSQAVPSAVGSRQMLDRFQVRPCTAGPVRSRPAAASAASAQARSAGRTTGPGVGQPQRLLGQRVRAGPRGQLESQGGGLATSAR